MQQDNALGSYLKDRRARLDAARLGYPMDRRRTPGLRREEVAQRANVSITWYTWLEQGRGGAPSAEVLDRLSRALGLTDVEREHLYLLGQNRPPEIQRAGDDAVSPQLQRVLDSFEYSPAYIKTATWDVLAWNRVSSKVMTDYGEMPDGKRNLLHLIFGNTVVRGKMPDWEGVARSMVATFRTETTRTGYSPRTAALVEELSALHPEFRTFWDDHEVDSHGQGIKNLHHAIAGPITLEYSSFAVDGKPNLTMVVYNPATPADRAAVESLLR